VKLFEIANLPFGQQPAVAENDYMVADRFDVGQQVTK
jgi:hypothetical protein